MLNPAFLLLQQPDFRDKLETVYLKRAARGKSRYYLIPINLQAEDKCCFINQNAYLMSWVHISVYENQDPSESRGDTCYHFTATLTAKDNAKNVLSLHVYFDRWGNHVSTDLKSVDYQSLVPIVFLDGELAALNAQAIRASNHFFEHVITSLNNTHQYLSQRYQALLAETEKNSKFINQVLPLEEFAKKMRHYQAKLLQVIDIVDQLNHLGMSDDHLTKNHFERMHASCDVLLTRKKQVVAAAQKAQSEVIPDLSVTAVAPSSVSVSTKKKRQRKKAKTASKAQLTELDQQLLDLETQPSTSQGLLLRYRLLSQKIEQIPAVDHEVVITTLKKLDELKRSIALFLPMAARSDDDDSFAQLCRYAPVAAPATLTILVSKGRLSAIKILLSNHAISFLQRISLDGNSILHVAYVFYKIEKDERYFNILQYLLQKGCDPNLTCVEGYTLLMWAACDGQSKVLDLLLEYRARVNQRPVSFTTFRPAENDPTPLATVLTALRATPSATAPNLKPTALLQAASNHQVAAMTQLIHAKASLHDRQEKGFNALGVYLERAQQRLPLSEEVVRLMMTQGCSLDELQGLVNKGRATPLFLACQNGDLEVVELLIRLGADVNKARIQKEDSFPLNPLIMVAYKGHLDIVNALLKCARLDTSIDNLFEAYTQALQQDHMSICEVIAEKMLVVHDLRIVLEVAPLNPSTTSEVADIIQPETSEVASVNTRPTL